MSSIMFLTIIACFTFVRAVPLQSGVCLDSSDACMAISNLCHYSEGLRKACPVTCNACQSCRAGYELAADGKTCIDIDECNHETNPCSSEGLKCVNTVGSYSCQKLNCENTLGASFRNYYKSDKCCQVQNDNVQPRTFSSKNDSKYVSEPTTNTVQWPWMAQILSNNRQVCGATIISNKWLVSSALCFSSVDYSQVKIFLGNDKSAQYFQSVQSSQIKRKIKQVIIHPNYLNNDIALIEMNQAVEFNNLIQPVRFPCGETPTVGQTCYVTGFGVKNDNRDAKPVRNLKQIGLPIVSSEYCATRYHGIDPIFNTTTNICAGFKNGGEDACFGDGGSPLVCQRAESCEWYLSGIFSTGRGCGRPGFPGIYTNVVEYESWIQNEIKEDFSAFCPQKIVNRLIPQLG